MSVCKDLNSVKYAVSKINLSMEEFAYFHSLLDGSLKDYFDDLMDTFDMRMKKLLFAVYADVHGDDTHDSLLEASKRTVVQLKRELEGFKVVK